MTVNTYPTDPAADPMGTALPWVYDDGGREAAGYQGIAGDCGVRSIAIATEQPYQDVYDSLRRLTGGKTPRDGLARSDAHTYLTSLGWSWVPTMQIGTGCRVHLACGELPGGRLVTRLSRHYAAVIDGIVHDTYDPSRDGSRCVYGYWIEP